MAIRLRQSTQKDQQASAASFGLGLDYGDGGARAIQGALGQVAGATKQIAGNLEQRDRLQQSASLKLAETRLDNQRLEDMRSIDAARSNGNFKLADDLYGKFEQNYLQKDYDPNLFLETANGEVPIREEHFAIFNESSREKSNVAQNASLKSYAVFKDKAITQNSAKDFQTTSGNLSANGAYATSDGPMAYTLNSASADTAMDDFFIPKNNPGFTAWYQGSVSRTMVANTTSFLRQQAPLGRAQYKTAIGTAEDVLKASRSLTPQGREAVQSVIDRAKTSMKSGIYMKPVHDATRSSFASIEGQRRLMTLGELDSENARLQSLRGTGTPSQQAATESLQSALSLEQWMTTNPYDLIKSDGILPSEDMKITPADLSKVQGHANTIMKVVNQAKKDNDWITVATILNPDLKAPLNEINKQLASAEPDLAAIRGATDSFREGVKEVMAEHPEVYPAEAQSSLIGLNTLVEPDAWEHLKGEGASEVVKHFASLSASNGGDGILSNWSNAASQSPNEVVREAAVAASLYTDVADPNMKESIVGWYLQDESDRPALPDASALTTVKEAIAKKGNPFSSLILSANSEGDTARAQGYQKVYEGWLYDQASKGASDATSLQSELGTVADSLGHVINLPDSGQAIRLDIGSMPASLRDEHGQLKVSTPVGAALNNLYAYAAGTETPSYSELAQEIESNFLHLLDPAQSGINLMEGDTSPFKGFEDSQDPIAQKVYAVVKQFIGEEDAFRMVKDMTLDSGQQFMKIGNPIWSEKEGAMVHPLRVATQIQGRKDYDAWIFQGGDSAALTYDIPKNADGEAMFYVRADKLYKESGDMAQINRERVQRYEDIFESGVAGFATLGVAPKIDRALSNFIETSQIGDVLDYINRRPTKEELEEESTAQKKRRAFFERNKGAAGIPTGF